MHISQKFGALDENGVRAGQTLIVPYYSYDFVK